MNEIKQKSTKTWQTTLHLRTLTAILLFLGLMTIARAGRSLYERLFEWNLWNLVGVAASALRWQ
jgi:hypothetical protein